MAINKALIQSFYSAANFLDTLRTTYQQAKAAQAKIALYQSGTDPQFNAAVNAIIPAADRARIAQMRVQIDALIVSWESDYLDIINPQ